MVGTLLLVVLVALFAAVIGAFIALKLDRSLFNASSIEGQQKIWEHAQDHSRNWENRQERRISELETRFTHLASELHSTLQDQAAQSEGRIQALEQQFAALERQTRVEQTLANLPRVEDTPLAANGHVFPDWHPPVLHDADLSGRDLSYRYLRQADLRNAQLVKTNFFMADLSGAFLSGANLSGADLSGANLSGADLRDAILTEANLQVADLQRAILTQANLLTVHNLTTQQLDSAVYDSSTMLDDDVNVTARMSAIKLPKAPKAEKIVQPSKQAPVEELAIPDLPTKNMPAVSLSNDAAFATEPAIPTASSGTLPVPPPETPFPFDEPGADEPAFLAAFQTLSPDDHVEEDFMEMPPLPTSSEEDTIPVATPEVATTPKAEDDAVGKSDTLQEPNLAEALTQSDIAIPSNDAEPRSQQESSFPSLLPDLDLESVIRQQHHSLLLSQLASGDSLLDPKVTDILVDRPDTSRTGELDNATPRRKRSGKRKARAS